MTKVKTLVESILFVIINIAIQLIVVIIAEIFIANEIRQKVGNIGLTLIQKETTQYIDDNILTLSLISWGIIMIIYYIIHSINKESILERSGFNTLTKFNMLICTILGISLNIFINGILSLMNQRLLNGYSHLVENVINNDFIVVLLVVGICAPIFEEILFRGIILNKLKEQFSASHAIIIQALLFSIVHMNFIQGLYGFILGCLFGFIVIWTESIYSAFILHIVINSLSIIVLSMKSININTTGMITITIISAILTIQGVRILYSKRKRNLAQIIKIG